MRKFHVIMLLLGAAAIVGAYRFLAPAPAPKSPLERMKANSPVESFRTSKPSIAPIRSVETSTPPAAKRTQMEERFVDLKDEGRRMREALMASDPKAALAYQSLSQRPDYRGLIDRRHQIEAAWASAPESEREGMLNEMNSLRQQGVGLILNEIQRINSLPPAPLAPTPQATPAGSAPPAPAAPVVFQ
jgi:hypothetical protein